MAARLLIAACIVLCGLHAQSAEDLATLFARFQSERDIAAKEAILFEITQHYPNAGARLLQLAKSTRDLDTEWLAIRGLGNLNHKPAVPFLVSCLNASHHYVRANAARALGEIKAITAETELMTLLRKEQDNGVIEQTSLALRMINATKAVPVLRTRVENTQNPQTKCWLIDAVAALGTRKDVPFIANRLYDTDEVVASCAAGALQTLTKEDMHFEMHTGPVSLSDSISKAKDWWEKNSGDWK